MKTVLILFVTLFPVSTLANDLPSYSKFQEMIRILVSKSLAEQTPRSQFYEVIRNDFLKYKYWKFVDDYKQTSKQKLTRDCLHTECSVQDFWLSTCTRVDLIWPFYFVDEGTVYYRLGELIAFTQRDRKPTDAAVKAQFQVELHRQMNQIEWHEDAFWNPVLNEAEEVAREIYNSTKGKTASSELFNEQDAQVIKLEQVIVASLKRRAEEFGIKRIKRGKPIDYSKRFSLVPFPDHDKELYQLWRIEEYTLQIADLVDVDLHLINDDWPEPEWQAPPKRPIEGKGAFYMRTLIDPDQVPQALKEIAKGRTPTYSERAEYDIRSFSISFYRQENHKDMLAPETYLGKTVLFRYGLRAHVTGYQRKRQSNVVYLNY